MTFYNVDHFPFVQMDVDGVLDKQPISEIAMTDTIVGKIPLTLKDIIVGKDIQSEQQITLLNLLNEYRDAFAMDLCELGCTNLVTMDIVEEKDSRPVVSKPYRTSI